MGFEQVAESDHMSSQRSGWEFGFHPTCTEQSLMKNIL